MSAMWTIIRKDPVRAEILPEFLYLPRVQSETVLENSCSLVVEESVFKGKVWE